jgi:hypothetical protein
MRGSNISIKSHIFCGMPLQACLLVTRAVTRGCPDTTVVTGFRDYKTTLDVYL